MRCFVVPLLTLPIDEGAEPNPSEYLRLPQPKYLCTLVAGTPNESSSPRNKGRGEGEA